MRPTVTPVLMKDKKRADETCPIYIRITANRRSCYVNTKVRVQHPCWNERRGLVRASDHLSQSKNNTIAQICMSANLAAENHRTAEAVKEVVMKGYSGVNRYLDEYIVDLGLNGKFWEQK